MSLKLTISSILCTDMILLTLLILAVCRTCVILNFIIDLLHCSLSGSMIEHWSRESEGLRFDSSWRLSFFFVPCSWQDEKHPSPVDNCGNIKLMSVIIILICNTGFSHANCVWVWCFQGSICWSSRKHDILLQCIIIPENLVSKLWGRKSCTGTSVWKHFWRGTR